MCGYRDRVNAHTFSTAVTVDPDGVRHAVDHYGHSHSDPRTTLEYTACGQVVVAVDEPHAGPVINCEGCWS